MVSTLEATPDDIFTGVQQTIAAQIGVDLANITAETRLEDLGVDSLERVEITQLLEKQFAGIALEDQQVRICETVGDLAALVRKAKQDLAAATPRAGEEE